MAEVIDRWKPIKVALSAEAVEHLRDVARRSKPKRVSSARSRLQALAHVADWLQQKGLAPEKATDEDLLDPAVLDDFDQEWLAHSPASSRNTWKGELDRASIRLLPDFWAVSEGDKQAHQPLTPPLPDPQFIEMLRIATAQMAAVRAQLLAILLLCRGAGLGASDLRFVTGNDVKRDRDGACIVVVRGKFKRIAVCLEQWAPQLLELAIARGADLMVGEYPLRKNIVDVLGKVRGARDMRRAVPAALRAGYMVEMMCARVPLGALMEQLGITSLRSFEDLLPYIPEPRSKEVRTWLSAGCR